MKVLKRGTQVAYIPTHANRDIHHPDVEFGFVTNAEDIGWRDETAYWCRFWVKGKLGVLRTVTNSERCYEWDIVEYTSVDQSVVDEILKNL